MKIDILFMLGWLLWLPLFAEAIQPPKESLIEIQHAIDTKNMYLFEKYVDVTTLLNQGVAYFFQTLRLAPNKANLPPLLFLLSTSAQNPNFVTEMTSFFVKEVSCFVQYGISSGLFAGSKTDIQSSTLLIPLLSEISTGRKELVLPQDIKLSTKNRQLPKKLLVPIHIKDYGNHHCYPVVLGMEMQKNIWRVTSIENLGELFRKFDQEIVQQ